MDSTGAQHWLWQAFCKPVTSFANPSASNFWVYVVGACVIAMIFDRNWRLLFSRRVWTAAATRVEIKFFVINSILFFWLPALSLRTAYAWAWDASLWCLRFLPASSGVVLPPAVYLLLATLFATLGDDFGYYVAHVASHKIPLLWRFHKVHHASTQLTFFTGGRSHAVDDMLIFGCSGIGAAFGTVLFIRLFPGNFAIAEIAGINAIGFLFRISKNLRHSDSRLSYGPFFDRIFCSPLMHQVHHGSQPRHWDKNFAGIFSLWDALFGTLYLAQEGEEIVYGIGEESAEYNTVISLYLRPFQRQKPADPPQQGTRPEMQTEGHEVEEAS